MMEREEILQLIRKAKEQILHGYAPYSRFYVAAALLCEDGSVYTGSNVENASYPAGICAERSAVSQAVSDGKRRFSAIAILGGKDGSVTEFCPPCGICRQVLREFCDPSAFQVILAKSEQEYKILTLEALLPESFGPENL